MQKRDFPYNMVGLLAAQPALAEGPEAKMAVIRTVMRQMLEALRSCHNTGEWGHC